MVMDELDDKARIKLWSCTHAKMISWWLLDICLQAAWKQGWVFIVWCCNCNLCWQTGRNLLTLTDAPRARSVFLLHLVQSSWPSSRMVFTLGIWQRGGFSMMQHVLLEACKRMSFMFAVTLPHLSMKMTLTKVMLMLKFWSNPDSPPSVVRPWVVLWPRDALDVMTPTLESFPGWWGCCMLTRSPLTWSPCAVVPWCPANMSSPLLTVSTTSTGWSLGRRTSRELSCIGSFLYSIFLLSAWTMTVWLSFVTQKTPTIVWWLEAVQTGVSLSMWRELWGILDMMSVPDLLSMMLQSWSWSLLSAFHDTFNPCVSQHLPLKMRTFLDGKLSWWSPDGETPSLLLTTEAPSRLPMCYSFSKSRLYHKKSVLRYGESIQLHTVSSNTPTVILVCRPLTLDHLCVWTRERGRAACQGDSGGPLTRVTDFNTYRRELVGVISLGSRVCGANKPVLVSKLHGKVLDWVSQTLTL